MKNIPTILFVCARPRDRKAAAVLQDEYRFHFIDLNHNTRFNVFDFDLREHLEEARDFLKKKGADGILFASDLGAVVAAVLCEEFDLPGPSIDSAFSCYHKYATRLATESKLAFEALTLDELEIHQGPFPFYIKAPTSAVGILGFTIQSTEDLKKAHEICRQELPTMNKAVSPLFAEHLDLNKHHYACTDIMLKEELIQQEQMTIEGFIHNGKLHFTYITDTNVFPDSRLIDNFSMPTRIPEAIQSNILSQAQQDISDIGLDNCFFNAEYFYDDNSTCLIEINSRATFPFHKLYQEVYQYNVYQAAAQLCLGQMPVFSPTALQAGGQFNFITTGEGQAAEFFDFDHHRIQDLNLFVDQEGHIQQRSEYGVVIAQAELFGKDHLSIQETADRLRTEVLK